MPSAGRGARSKWVWYARVGLYIGVLGIIVYLMHITRGKIPQAFGLTPISVQVLSVDSTPAGDAGQADVAVAVRIVGQDSIYRDVRLRQFRVETESGDVYRPYASDLLFDETGKLTIAKGDTLRGTLLFLIRETDTPLELWWEP